MSNFKSHFVFTKEQRNGIFILLLAIVVLQCVYFFVDFSSEESLVNETELKAYEAEIDSLKQLNLEENKPKMYPFNPNYITDYKGATLGMSIAEIDRLLAFRKQDKWVNSSKQFQDVTGVSDSLLEAISPYFKFPEWVTKPKPTKNYSNNNYGNKPKSFQSKIDLNKATALQLQKVNGIGKTLSQRIIAYRDKFKGGFVSDVQLQDVYGLSPEVITNLKGHFTVKTPRVIKTFNINTATTEELVTIQYVGYEEAYNIIEYRKLHEGFSSLDELRKVKDFPLSKLEIIKLSLHIQ